MRTQNWTAAYSDKRNRFIESIAVSFDKINESFSRVDQGVRHWLLADATMENAIFVDER